MPRKISKKSKKIPQKRKKSTEKKRLKKEKIKKTEKKAKPLVLKKEGPERYWEAVGRRKTAVARVRIFTKGEKEFLVNKKPYKEYFPTLDLWQTTLSPLQKMNTSDRFRILTKVKGGGYHAQAQAVRHAIARALVKFNPNFQKRLRKAGYLTRDPRMRERKKPGLKRARRAPQWKKR